MSISNFEDQYTQITSALIQAGIITPLPGSGLQGVVGIDGMEYPPTSFTQIQGLFVRSKVLIEQKISQGFTQLFLTPLAMPIPTLIERVSAAISSHAQAGTVFRSNSDRSGVDTPTQVNPKEPVWMWERVRQVLDTNRVVYFPQVYTPQGHQGMSKEEAMHNKRICAFPGWSVGLIEPLTILPQPGKGRLIGDRQQLDCGSSPREYRQALSAPVFRGESGWTLEDFLTYFITRLELTHQVSHDRADDNALWLLGQYLPDLEKTPNLVPAAYWSSLVGKKLYLTTHRTGNHFSMCGARTIVRLADLTGSS